MPHPLLTPEQAQRLFKLVGVRLRWLGHVRRRMELKGFEPADPLYVATCKAYDALHELHVRAHYAGCESGVGNPPQTSGTRSWPRDSSGNHRVRRRP